MSSRHLLCLMGMALVLQVACAADNGVTTKHTDAPTTKTEPSTEPSTTATKTEPHTTTATTKPHATTATTKPHETTATTKPITTATTKPHETTATTKPHATTATTKPHATTATTKPHATTATTKPHATTATTKPITTATTKPHATTKPSTAATTKPAPKPTTRPTVPPTTQPPVPHYDVLDSENKTCLSLSARITFNITSGNVTITGNFNKGTYAGSCGTTESDLNITSTDEDIFINLNFQQSASSLANGHGKKHDKSMHWHGTELNIIQSGGEDDALVYANISSVSARSDERYDCVSMTFPLHLNGTVVGHVTFDDFDVQPFGIENNKLSTRVHKCNAANPVTNNLVPIAVGAALAGLVVIVLVAYAIGRSRSGRRGYQAV